MSGFGGISESAPLRVGFTALVNQNRALACLSIGLTKSYSSVFHGIADLSSDLAVVNGTSYAAVTGFNASTGLGTRQGAPLIAALRGGVLAE